MLGRFGWLPDLESTPSTPENRKRLNDLLTLRTMLMKQRRALQKLLAELELGDGEGPSTLLSANAAACTDCEHRIRTCIAAGPALARHDAIIQSIPGLGPVTAALLSLAPFARDSGQHHGHRRIRGGRAQPAMSCTARTASGSESPLWLPAPPLEAAASTPGPPPREPRSRPHASPARGFTPSMASFLESALGNQNGSFLRLVYELPPNRSLTPASGSRSYPRGQDV